MEHISIHALREEGDGAPHPAGARTQHFYPRPPRGGRRSRNSSFGKSKVFLSTPSARRATTRGLRRSCRGPISIHALREEGDAYTAECMEALKVFLSTPSARRATCWPPPPCLRPVISIHALREEGDSLLPPRPAACPNFYPRPPRGGRPFPDSSGTLRWPYFYPRHPRGGRQFAKAVSLEAIKFLSTPSARRATPRICEVGNIKKDFYPRPPRGGRRSSPSAKASRPEFLSTPSARRATYKPDGRCNISGISIHALREEGDLLFR